MYCDIHIGKCLTHTGPAETASIQFEISFYVVLKSHFH